MSATRTYSEQSSQSAASSVTGVRVVRNQLPSWSDERTFHSRRRELPWRAVARVDGREFEAFGMTEREALDAAKAGGMVV
jgi:hypothetical protein